MATEIQDLKRGEYILPIIRNEQGYLVEADGSYVDTDNDRRVLFIGYRTKFNCKADSIKGIIERYKQTKEILKQEESKKEKNEKRIKRAKEILKNIEETLNREKDYIRKHFHMDVANIISTKIK